MMVGTKDGRARKIARRVGPDWDFAGAVEDLRLLLEAGWLTAETDTWPEWKNGSEFKARRETMLSRGKPAR